MPSLNIKGFPEDLYHILGQRAKQDRRSLTSEAIYLLEWALEASQKEKSSILQLRGLGKKQWKKEDAVKHVDQREFMGIIEDIGLGPVCLDTSVFIYFIEEDKRYIDIVTQIFEAIDIGLISAVTSGVTLLETLVIPFRNKDNALALQYEQLFCESKGLTLVNLDRDLLRQAANLRANLQDKNSRCLTACLCQARKMHVICHK